ncbi:MAG: lipopolysaccharide biosynthesis protein [Anaerolineae bacterium]|nr:lipopolysaccharide biosynthesis protein [Anaerolineae bacterium]MBT7188772.1 lipopolysaccharide biosynthesis protein [Anaerolineae bacterium]MBT7600565.1 lipopolysaccharide biosynthesis protein [Anaerolineae bacterium]MBT7988753.1 lipopolysaccharide biosynthesis protein [Anaerolineae bacterium]
MNSSAESTKFGLVAIQGTVWRYASYFGGKLMVFLSTLVLARLLSIEDFGIVGYALASIAFLDIASDLGMAEAVVFHKEDSRTNSTAFWVSLGIGFFLFGLSWILAPFLAIYFKDDRVIPVFRAITLTFPVTALGSTHDALLRKELAFGKTALPEFLRALTKGVVSVVLAFSGFGAWSLVWGQVGGTLVASIILWLITPWHPTFEFDIPKATALITYGVKYIGTDILSVLLLNIDYLLIGRYLGATALGIYVLAYRVPELLILQFARILSKVTFPIYTKMRDIPGGMARGFGKATSYVSLITIPIGLGLMVIARPFTLMFLTDKWENAIPVMQGIAIYCLFLSLIHNSGSVYKALGKFDVMTWIGITRLLLLFPALWWATTVAESIIAVGWMHALIAFVGSVISLLVTARILGLPLRELFNSLLPSILAGAIMAFAVYAILQLTLALSSIEQLLITIPSGGLIYLAALWFVRRDVIIDVYQRLSGAILRRQKKYA